MMLYATNGLARRCKPSGRVWTIRDDVALVALLDRSAREFSPILKLASRCYTAGVYLGLGQRR